jgi:probable biosynthetic protein (TIGR04099 family)
MDGRAMDGLLHSDVVVSLEQARSRFAALTGREARSTVAIVLGTPHLTANGLCENWLLKELGHRHWLLVAELAGMSAPRFCDPAGNPVYGVFCALSIADADFLQAYESRVLHIASSLARISDTQIQSTHRLTIDGFAIGTVTMISTFVSRTVGYNHAVARAVVDGLPPVKSAVLDFSTSSRPRGTSLTSAGPAPAPSGLARLAAELCAGRLCSHMGFDPRVEKEVCSAAFDPCPSVDFNSAGFMYFANLIAMIDRMEHRLDREAALRATTADRDVFFYGNVVRSETVEVRLLGWRRDAYQIVHHFRMIRGSDGRATADVFTRRALGGFTSALAHPGS